MKSCRLSVRLNRICSRITDLRDRLTPDSSPDVLEDRARLSLAVDLILQVADDLKKGGEI